MVLLSVVCLCCRKKNSEPTTTTTDDNFGYTVKYDSVITANAAATHIFSFSIKVLGGNIANNKLTCMIEGLPATVSVDPDSIVVGQLLGGVFYMSIGTTIAIGDYPFTLKIRSARYGLRTYNLVLRIVPPTDFAPMLAGAYDSCYDYCPGPGFTYYSTNVSVVTDTPYLLRLTNVRNWGTTAVVRAWVSSVITVPLQEVAGRKIWGKGTYSQDARAGHEGQYLMSISDTIVTGTDTVGCTMHIEH